jgi:hypothetical protein
MHRNTLIHICACLNDYKYQRKTTFEMIKQISMINKMDFHNISVYGNQYMSNFKVCCLFSLLVPNLAFFSVLLIYFN